MYVYMYACIHVCLVHTCAYAQCIRVWIFMCLRACVHYGCIFYTALGPKFWLVIEVQEWEKLALPYLCHALSIQPLQQMSLGCQHNSHSVLFVPISHPHTQPSFYYVRPLPNTTANSAKLDNWPTVDQLESFFQKPGLGVEESRLVSLYDWN